MKYSYIEKKNRSTIKRRFHAKRIECCHNTCKFLDMKWSKCTLNGDNLINGDWRYYPNLDEIERDVDQYARDSFFLLKLFVRSDYCMGLK